jgi:hypothetical protein
MNEGDWVEGAPKWWWIYVFPARSDFWRLLLRPEKMGPEPDPWAQEITADLPEAAVMVPAIAKVPDAESKARLRKEIDAKIQGALQSLAKARLCRAFVSLKSRCIILSLILVIHNQPFGLHRLIGRVGAANLYYHGVMFPTNSSDGDIQRY